MRLSRLLYRAAFVPWLHARSLAQAIQARGSFRDVRTYCQFIGYPRSGHTLVYALLNAHPEVVLSNELGALQWMRFGFTRAQLYSMILRSDRRFTRHGSTFQGYDYRVPNQWQGRFRRILVIGDKDGGRDTTFLRHSPDALERFQRKVGVPIRFIHVVRNPYDMMTTFVNRRVQRGERTTLDDALRFGREALDTVMAVVQRVPAESLLTIRHEEMIQDPVSTVSRLCRHLGVIPEDDYLKDCAGIVSPSSRKTRRSVEWPEELIRRVQAEMIDRSPLLSGYRYEA
jgi:hypothetical protein